MRSAIMLIALLALALATATASGSPSACIAGEKKAGGGEVIVNCGPAQATVRVGGRPTASRRGCVNGGSAATRSTSARCRTCLDLGS